MSEGTGEAVAPDASGPPSGPTERELRVRRAALIGAAGVFVVAGLLAASALGLPVPWRGSGPDYGVAREIPLPSSTVGEPSAEEPAEIPMPAHLMPRTPGHLDEESEPADEPPPEPQPNSRISAPAAPVSS